MTMQSDSQIIELIISGHKNQFGLLVDRYSNYLSSIAVKHVPYSEVEEIVQESYIKAYSSLKALQKKGSFKSWMSQIVVRSCYDYWRTKHTKWELSASVLNEQQSSFIQNILQSDDFSVDELVEKRESKELLNKALQSLSAEDRMIITLVYFEHRSIKETAQLLGWSQVNVKVRSYRVRKKLKKTINQWLHG